MKYGETGNEKKSLETQNSTDLEYDDVEMTDQSITLDSMGDEI